MLPLNSRDLNADAVRNSRALSDLLSPLGIHLLFLIAYAGVWLVLVEIGGNASFGSSEFFWTALSAGWIELFVPLVWLLVALNLIRWWIQRRQELVRRTLVWDSLLWLGVGLVALFLSSTTRAWLIPRHTVGEPTPSS